jgi:hypothetical protein
MEFSLVIYVCSRKNDPIFIEFHPATGGSW